MADIKVGTWIQFWFDTLCIIRSLVSLTNIVGTTFDIDFRSRIVIFYFSIVLSYSIMYKSSYAYVPYPYSLIPISIFFQEKIESRVGPITSVLTTAQSSATQKVGSGLCWSSQITLYWLCEQAWSWGTEYWVMSYQLLLSSIRNLKHDRTMFCFKTLKLLISATVSHFGRGPQEDGENCHHEMQDGGQGLVLWFCLFGF